jgi:hypothetical protein
MSTFRDSEISWFPDSRNRSSRARAITSSADDAPFGLLRAISAAAIGSSNLPG